MYGKCQGTLPPNVTKNKALSLNDPLPCDFTKVPEIIVARWFDPWWLSVVQDDVVLWDFPMERKEQGYQNRICATTPSCSSYTSQQLS